MAQEQTQRTLAEIERIGFAALCEQLGPADALRFIQIFDLGSGDYTRERDVLFEGETVDILYGAIEQRRKH